MAPKTTQETLVKCRLQYESGNFKSVYALAREHGINPDSLHQRIRREKWAEKRAKVLQVIERKMEKATVSKAESYLSNLQNRVEKYEKIIDASMENLGSKTAEGIPLLDPEAIDQFTRSEGRIQAIGAFAHRIPAQTSLDVTSKGESLVAIIERMRADPSKVIDLTPSQVDQIASMEVEG